MEGVCMYDIRSWRHVFKLDPNKSITDEELEKVCESGTDAILIGGTDGVTLENVLDLMARVRRYTVPCILEISSIDTVTPGFDLYFVPTVLNSRDPKWITGLHQEAVKEYGHVMEWDDFIVEGYCILNRECKAAQVTNANTDLTKEDVAAYALMAEKMFHLPIFYVEFSGTYGDAEIIEEVKNVLEETILFYGGGIKSQEQAKEMASIADVVVVGNIIYENLKEALRTVQSVKESIEK
jgi:putative glycerol-1-phosphate prenyltransferase